MTKEEAQVQYRDIAARMGDAVFKLERVQAIAQGLQKELDKLREEKTALEAKVVSDVEPASATA